ncbi:hypothetical protein Golax_009346 [Gossypium laxum]|uniref:Uncharacterized protein n=1 Tax=Gossypium laxum TaxID=34288 RepID=A0A7J9ADC6_9ROSI|nr:hypothetical protein [Gossypium laxum]
MTTENRNTVVDDSEKKDRIYGPWMIVERKSRQKFRENVQNSLGLQSDTNAEMDLHLEGEASTFWANLKSDGRDRNEVVMKVRSLDFGKHSAAVFHESNNFKNKNSDPSSNNNLDLSPVDFSGINGTTRREHFGFSKNIFDAEVFTESDKQKEGVNIPGQ